MSAIKLLRMVFLKRLLCAFPRHKIVVLNALFKYRKAVIFLSFRKGFYSSAGNQLKYHAVDPIKVRLRQGFRFMKEKKKVTEIQLQSLVILLNTSCFRKEKKRKKKTDVAGSVMNPLK